MWSLFSFRGRTNRLGYWRVQLLANVIVAVFWVLGLFAMQAIGPLGAFLFVPAALIVPIILATWFRRLHDRGKGLWWAALFLLAPALCNALADGLQGNNTEEIKPETLPFSLLALVIIVWAFIELGFVRGQPGPNRFGDPPAPGR
jgi:uncharacterized membrane protein YhaH (DUF805 family)